jgi:serine/threonine protein kinase
MAELFLARLPGIEGFDKKVVIKRVLPSLARDRDFIDMFLEEARLAATLHHQNIVQVHDIGQDEDGYFFAMEHLLGIDVGELMRVVSRQDGLPLEIALEIARGACAGLHHAHERTSPAGGPLGIVHRDVSPSNLIVSTVGFVKLIDFGLAKAKHSSVESNAGIIKGKINYVAPEYLDGNLDVRCDLWALGVVIWELLTGRRLFDAQDHFQMVEQVRSMPIPPPSRYRAEVTSALDDIVLTALQRDPAKRWQNAASFRAALAGQARGYPVVTKSQLVTWIEWAFAQKKNAREDSGVAALADILESGLVQVVDENEDAGSALLRLPATSAAIDERKRDSVAAMPVEAKILRPTAPSSRWPLILALIALVAAIIAALLVLGVLPAPGF